MAAIAIDNAGVTFKSASSASSLTYSFTINTSTGSTILFVGVMINTGIITGVTYNGVSMTQIASASEGFRQTYLYYVVNPAAGAANVVVSCSGSATSIFSRAVSYTGALQTGVPDASATAHGASVTSIAPSVTSIANGCWVVGMLACNGSNSTVLSSGVFRDGGDGLDSVTMFDSNGIVSPGAHAYTWNNFGTADAMGVIASFAPSTPPISGRMLLVF